MIRGLWILISIWLVLPDTQAQTKAELEEKRRKALEEIAYVDNMLQATSREKKESLNELTIIGISCHYGNQFYPD